MRTRLRTLEIELMEREYAQLVGRSTPVEERLRSLNEDSSRIDTDLSGEESRLESLRNRMLESEKRLAEEQRDVSLQREAMHQVEESNAVAAERIKSLRANAARLENEQADLRLNLARMGQERISLEGAIAGLRAREAATAGDLAAILGLTRSQAGIRHLLDVSLVHQIHIHWGFKDLGRQFHGLDLIAFHVENVYFHNTHTPIIGAYCLRASLIMTKPPLGPGTAPRTPSRLRSTSTRTTFRP